jgi:hypothetical protein
MLGRIILILRNLPLYDVLECREAELELENLILHLPRQMEEITGDDGEVNETIFQTQMLIQA